MSVALSLRGVWVSEKDRAVEGDGVCEIREEGSELVPHRLTADGEVDVRDEFSGAQVARRVLRFVPQRRRAVLVHVAVDEARDGGSATAVPPPRWTAKRKDDQPDDASEARHRRGRLTEAARTMTPGDEALHEGHQTEIWPGRRCTQQLLAAATPLQ